MKQTLKTLGNSSHKISSSVKKKKQKKEKQKTKKKKEREERKKQKEKQNHHYHLWQAHYVLKNISISWMCLLLANKKLYSPKNPPTITNLFKQGSSFKAQIMSKNWVHKKKKKRPPSAVVLLGGGIFLTHSLVSFNSKITSRN